jgi:hypothetical protein
MEISQGNFLCNYLYLKQAKMSFLFFFSFFFSLLQNQKTGRKNRSCPGWGEGTNERRKVAGKGVGG